MKRFRETAFVLGMLAMPALASAQAMPSAEMRSVYVAPLIGVTVAGDTTSSGTSVGVAGGWRSKAFWGVEGELASTPNFFEQSGFLTNRWVTTFMVNAMVLHTMARTTVFGTGGFGVMHVDLAEAGGLAAIKTNEPGFNIGGGAMWTVSHEVSVRGDLRYFRATGNSDNDVNLFNLEVSKLQFMRVSASLVVGF